MDWDTIQSVRREDLQSDVESGDDALQNRDISHEPSLEARYLDRLKSEYAAQTSIGTREHTVEKPDQEPVHNEQHEFRLFAPSIPQPGINAGEDAPQVVQISLRSPTPIDREPGFTIPQRSSTYYFTSDLSEELSKQYQQVLIDGNDIVKGWSIPYTGCSLPWRVTAIKIGKSKAGVKTSKICATAEKEIPKRATRTGKKRRIILRKRLQVTKAKNQSAQESQVQREEAEREKRSRKNRDKKLKKRQKKRDEKVMNVPENID